MLGPIRFSSQKMDGWIKCIHSVHCSHNKDYNVELLTSLLIDINH